tara:strand:+ start:2875 stop:5031 length:2157 start_codon:yes stop_codon:yes gene_type:complete
MKLDFQDIFTGKAETDRINREYARGLARDAAKDKLKQDFVMDLSRQVFIDGPEKARRETTMANLQGEDLKKSLREVNMKQKQSIFEQNYAYSEIIANAPTLEEGAEKVAKDIFNQTPIGQILMNNDFGKGATVPDYQIKAYKLKEKEILSDLTKEILENYEGFTKLGNPEEFALRSGQRNIDIYNLGSKVAGLKGDKMTLFGNVLGGTDAKIAELNGLRLQVEQQMENDYKIVERGLTNNNKFIDSKNYQDLAKEIQTPFVMSENKTDIKAFKNSFDKDENLRAAVFSLPRGMLKGSDNIGFLRRQASSVFGSDVDTFKLTANKENFKIYDTVIDQVTNTVTRSKEPVPNGQYTLENVFFNDLLPIAEAIQYEHLRAGGGKRSAQEYLNLAFQTLAKAEYIEQDNDGNIVYQRPLNMNQQIVGIDVLPKEERSKLLVDKLYTQGLISISKNADRPVDSFISSNLTAMQDKIDETITNPESSEEERKKANEDQDDINNSQGSVRASGTLSVKQLIRPSDETTIGQEIDIDGNGFVVKAGQLSYEEALELYDRKLINDYNSQTAEQAFVAEDDELAEFIAEVYLPNATTIEKNDFKNNLKTRQRIKFKLDSEDYLDTTPPAKLERDRTIMERVSDEIISLQNTQGTRGRDKVAEAIGSGFRAVGQFISDVDKRASINRIEQQMQSIQRSIDSGTLSNKRVREQQENLQSLEQQLEQLKLN